MSTSFQYFYLGLLCFGGVSAATHGATWFTPALVFYCVYLTDYAPRQEAIAQAMRLRALQKEARMLKEDSKEKAELEALREKVRQLEEKK